MLKKELFKKFGKVFASKLMFLVLGVCLAIGGTAVYAAWQGDAVSVGTLTMANWNALVSGLADIKTSLGSVGGGGGINWSDCEFKTNSTAGDGTSWATCTNNRVIVASVCTLHKEPVTYQGNQVNMGGCRFSMNGGQEALNIWDWADGSIKCCAVRP